MKKEVLTGGKWENLTAVIQTEQFKNCNSKRLLKHLGNLNSEHLKIKDFITPNILVFSTDNVKEAGKHIEKWLLSHFKEKK